jgi:hypothetical protein
VFVNAAAILALAEESTHVLGPPGETTRPKLAPTT